MPESLVARLLADLVGCLPPVIPTVGIYAAGSLGTRDFEPDRSDLDIVVVVEHAPTDDETHALTLMHRALAREHPGGARLHCLYVAADQIDDGEREWPSWSDGKLGRRRLTAITRLELHDHGVVVAGPPIASQIPYVTPEDLLAAVRTELTGVWLPATDKVSPWLDDAMVDRGLTLLPRAQAAITEGVLLTKSQAIAQLEAFEVPDWLRQDMLSRRRGWATDTSRKFRARRARVARDAVRRGVQRLLAESAEGA